MKEKDLVIGNKYVPIAKTVYSATGSRDESAEWNSAKQANQPYLYYTGVHLNVFDSAGKRYHCFSSTKLNIREGPGDYFMLKDVVPYVESSNGHVYKRGDRAVIIGDNFRHEIKIGTEVIIKRLRAEYDMQCGSCYEVYDYNKIVSNWDLMPVAAETPLVKENKKVLEVEREFVEQAYDAACPDWKKKLEHKFPDLFQTHKVGDMYTRGGDKKYLLAQVGYRKVCMIDLEAGNHYLDPVKVSEVNAITAQEFRKITQCDKFTKIIK